MTYDPRPVLRRMEAGEESKDLWQEFWHKLHHQGDIDDASYAVVPHLIRIYGSRERADWNFYSLISVIEIERHRSGNPKIPDWIRDAYFQAWSSVESLAFRDMRQTSDRFTIQAALGAVALSKGLLKLGAFIAKADLCEIDEFLEERDGWSECYVDQ